MICWIGTHSETDEMTIVVKRESVRNGKTACAVHFKIGENSYRIYADDAAQLADSFSLAASQLYELDIEDHPEKIPEQVRENPRYTTPEHTS